MISYKTITYVTHVHETFNEPNESAMTSNNSGQEFLEVTIVLYIKADN